MNEGMYGKALAQYLQTKLRERGYEAPFVCCEDWGWWVELKGPPFPFGVCIYAAPGQKPPAPDRPADYVCTDGAVGPRQWSWRKFRFVDTAPWVQKLHADLLAIFQADPEVETCGVSDDFPL